MLACAYFFLFIEGFDDRLYRGGFLLFAVLGAAVVAGVMADERGALARILSLGPLPWVGRISYGLYLWHWPVAVWINPIEGRFSGATLLLIRTVVSFGAATASYYLVERPIRTASWQRLRLPRLSTAGAMGAVSVVLVGGMLIPVSPPSPPAKAAKSPVRHPVPADRPDDLRVLTVGDSVAWSLGWGTPKQAGMRIATAAALGCGILPGRMINNGVIHIETGVPPCATERSRWAQAIENMDPDVIVFGYGAWEVYDHVFGTEVYKVFSDRYRRELLDTLRDDVDFLRSKTSAPIVFLDAPCMHQPSFELGEQPNPRNSASRIRWINGVLDEFVATRHDAVAKLAWSKFLCPDGKFQETFDGVVLRPDGVHFNATTAPIAWEWLRPRLVELVTTLGRAEGDVPARGS